jgi:hypothetical protein
MDPTLRARFNADFSPAKYEALLNCVQQSERWPADFRIAETPLFLTREFTEEIAGAARELVAQTRTPEFARHAADAIPDGMEVPNEPRTLTFSWSILEFAKWRDDSRRA